MGEKKEVGTKKSAVSLIQASDAVSVEFITGKLNTFMYLSFQEKRQYVREKHSHFSNTTYILCVILTIEQYILCYATVYGSVV